MRTYLCWIIRVTFVLGLRTDTLFTDGKIIEKSTYKHMERKRSNVVTMLERIQRNHQKQLFQEASVSIQSQAAYELAEQGKNSTCATLCLTVVNTACAIVFAGQYRPAHYSDGLIYGFQLVNFDAPDVTVDVTAVNVDETYLAELVDEIGEKVKTNATTKSIRLMRLVTEHSICWINLVPILKGHEIEIGQYQRRF